jgi:hypothetical protein
MTEEKNFLTEGLQYQHFFSCYGEIIGLLGI